MSQPAKYFSPFESEIITVIVGAGDDARNFHLHKDVACRASSFFSGCLATEHFPEGRLKTISLPEDYPDIFAYLLTLMYSPYTCVRETMYVQPTATYVMAYVLADKLLMPKVCDLIMDSILEEFSTRDEFSGALDGLTAFEFPECTATEFLIEQLAWDLREKGYESLCACKDEKEGVACSWCTFLTNGGSGVVKMLKMFKETDEDVACEPCMRPSTHWHKHKSLSRQRCAGLEAC